ncbi:Calcineurin-like phosphoesterase domain, ApaH type [uncultured Caudovirales phage]|uniref:Calcineurin-like phosphoesterase domain, ApaH type n=1 Tax=uncultured Caudovirales phage TaxID=2100421 RepID=A0A6J5L1E0_9CAUD|nr:Calcineurin-like phosphoesterase domain, ApaH type [uncultured Caudovirales phage]CAB5170219.1 Calcineurin-like phosphoesterase domain, ApaH type [uncultured Caudovirales phage]
MSKTGQMGGSNTTMSGKIVLDYLAKYPDWMPSRTLASLILKENSNHFTDIENVRYLVRYYRGKVGKDKLDVTKMANSSFVEELKRTSSPFGMPDTWVEDKQVYHLPISLKKMGFISDLQVPFHDPKAIQLTFDYLNKEKIDSLFINGDLVDFYQLSDFQKDPRVRKFDEEYESIIEMLGFIRKSFPKIPIYYNLDANHEFRYERYMRTKAPELLGLKGKFELEEILMLNTFGIIPIKNIDHVKFGHLPIIHGDTTFRRGSGVSPAKTLFDRVKQSAIASHVHRTNEYTTKNQFDAEIFTCWTTGHLMHPNVEYCKHVDQYNQGFAVLEKDKTGKYRVYNKRIIDYEIY